MSAKSRALSSASAEPTRARAASAKREEKRLKPGGEGAKKGSKLGSILKKTGRVLKKPFGF